MKLYELVPIKNFLDALEVKNIRNQCRFFMTHNTSEINLFQQLLWYVTVYRKKDQYREMACFLFKDSTKPIGFGLIKKKANKYWITGGLKIEQRGKGIGEVLFKRIIQEVPAKDVWLEVLESNSIAKKIYQKLGFKKSKGMDKNGKKVIVMKLIKSLVK